MLKRANVEIQKIGLKKWIWFVLYLERDEFHEKLNIEYYFHRMDDIIPHRNLAHDISEILETVRF